MTSDVCEGCRRLRKKCDKDDCVLLYSLEMLWPHSRRAQSNATNFLAKYYGRKKFLGLLRSEVDLQRPALFKSLLEEACAREVDRIHGIAGLMKTKNMGECYRKVEAVLNGESGGNQSSPSHSISEVSARGYDMKWIPEASVINGSSISVQALPPSTPFHESVGSCFMKRERDEDDHPPTPEECVGNPPRKRSGRVYCFDLNKDPMG